MRKTLLLLILAGCQQAAPVEVQPSSELSTASILPEGILQAAEQVAFRAVESYHPTLDPAPAANCIRDNGTNSELLFLADGTKHTTTPDEHGMVVSILARSATRRCLTDNGQAVNG